MCLWMTSSLLPTWWTWLPPEWKRGRRRKYGAPRGRGMKQKTIVVVLVSLLLWDQNTRHPSQSSPWPFRPCTDGETVKTCVSLKWSLKKRMQEPKRWWSREAVDQYVLCRLKHPTSAGNGQGINTTLFGWWDRPETRFRVLRSQEQNSWLEHWRQKQFQNQKQWGWGNDPACLAYLLWGSWALMAVDRQLDDSPGLHVLWSQSCSRLS